MDFNSEGKFFSREISDLAFIRLKVTRTMPESLRAYLAIKVGILDAKDILGKTFETGEITSSKFVAMDGLLGLALCGD